MIYADILASLENENRLRRIPDTLSGLDLLSNDYMGLAARHEEFMAEYNRRFGPAPMSASASRLLQRHQEQHFALESMLSEMYGKDILLMNSGYHANAGALSALSVKETLIVSDKLSHASMIDGIRLGAGDNVRFAHNDMDMLRKILKKKASDYDTVIVATESAFSMDGDLSPLIELTAIKKEFPNVLLYVDEAHAFGVFGERGLGLAEAAGVMEDIDVLIVTLGKAAAGFGAFIATSPLLRSYLVNSARSFIFSTALPPAVEAWNMLMIEKLAGMTAEREHLHKLAAWFRKELSLLTGTECVSRSQIVPVMAGSATRAISIASALRDAGIDALPIRRPTVPIGGERIRLSLSAGLSEADLNPVLEVLSRAIG